MPHVSQRFVSSAPLPPSRLLPFHLLALLSPPLPRWDIRSPVDLGCDVYAGTYSKVTVDGQGTEYRICEPCEPNTYQPQTGQTQCVPLNTCEPGTYISEVHFTFCFVGVFLRACVASTCCLSPLCSLFLLCSPVLSLACLPRRLPPMGACALGATATNTNRLRTRTSAYPSTLASQAHTLTR